MEIKISPQIKACLSLFKDTDILDVEKYTKESQPIIGKSLLILKRELLVWGLNYANEVDFPISGSLTQKGKELRDSLNLK